MRLLSFRTCTLLHHWKESILHLLNQHKHDDVQSNSSSEFAFGLRDFSDVLKILFLNVLKMNTSWNIFYFSRELFSRPLSSDPVKADFRKTLRPKIRDIIGVLGEKINC